MMNERWHRPLSEMLTDIFDSILTAGAGVVRMRALQVALPIEISLRELNGEETFIADVPVWRWRTEFEQPTSRMSITWEEQTS